MLRVKEWTCVTESIDAGVPVLLELTDLDVVSHLGDVAVESVDGSLHRDWARRNREEFDGADSLRGSFLQQDERGPDELRIDVELLAEVVLVEEQLILFPAIPTCVAVPTPRACLEIADIQDRVTVLGLSPYDDIDKTFEFHLDVVISIDVLEERVFVVNELDALQLVTLVDVPKDVLSRTKQILELSGNDRFLVSRPVLLVKLPELFDEEQHGHIDRHRVLPSQVSLKSLVDSDPEIEMDRERIIA